MELEFHVAGVVLEVVVVADADRPERFERVVDVRGDLLPGVEQLGRRRAERREKQLLLAGEVAIERGLGDAGRFRHVRGTDFPIALAGDYLARRLDDLTASDVRG